MRARMCSEPTTASATRSGRLLTPSPLASSERSSAGERGGDRERRALRVGDGEAGVERLRGGAHDLGQSRARTRPPR